MSGELYEVLGDCRFVPIKTCPEELKSKTFRLRPSDGEPFELNAEVACVAAWVRSRILDPGTDEEIKVPVKRATVNKVVEYMKYHSQIPPGDIRTPLLSDDLAECGASKWDVNFINVDKRMLIELLYAASAMDIPSLGLLAKAKASLMMLGKTSDEIRKDFNFANDLPNSEEQAIQDMVKELRRKRNMAGNDDDGGTGNIAPATALVGSVWRLAEAESAGTAGEGDSEGEGGAGVATAIAPSAASWRQGSWRAAVVEDWQRLASAPAEVRADRELLLASLVPSQGKALAYASNELRADRRLVLSAVSSGAESLREAGAELRVDRDFVLEAVLINGLALSGAAEVLRGDRDLVLRAAEAGRGSALKGASDKLRGDAAFVIECAERDPQALSGASDALRDDKAFILGVVGSLPGTLRYAPLALRADREVVEAAIARDPSAALYAHASRRADLVAGLAPDAVAAAETSGARHTGPMHAGVPLSAETATQGFHFCTHKLTKSIVFTALSTVTPNMGQSNYIAANSFLDKLAPYERPEIDSTGIMWGTVGGMGMRWKAFASADFMLQQPDLLMGIDEAAKVLHVIATKMEMPEWVGANFMDPETRAAIVEQSGKVGGYRPSEDTCLYPSISSRSKGIGPDPAAWRPLRHDVEGVQEAERPGIALGVGGGSHSFGRQGPSEDADAPLGGWPILAGAAATTSGAAASSGARRPVLVLPAAAPSALAAAAAKGEDWELTVGAQVQLVGLKNKNGTTGVVVKAYPEGRYKVALDDKRGSALLRSEYLQVIAPARAIACH